MFITYDRDAHNEIIGSLSRLGLKENEHFIPLGLEQSGKDCIEGLLPQRVLAQVNGRETDLVMKLGSADGKERRKAKEALKRKYLNEFNAVEHFGKEELKELAKVVKIVNKQLS